MPTFFQVIQQAGVEHIGRLALQRTVNVKALVLYAAENTGGVGLQRKVFNCGSEIKFFAELHFGTIRSCLFRVLECKGARAATALVEYLFDGLVEILVKNAGGEQLASITFNYSF